eukprot:SAG11_NODE_47_length_20431_cov_7.472752_13_plen_193_part_00
MRHGGDCDQPSDGLIFELFLHNAWRLYRCSTGHQNPFQGADRSVKGVRNGLACLTKVASRLPETLLPPPHDVSCLPCHCWYLSKRGDASSVILLFPLCLPRFTSDWACCAGASGSAFASGRGASRGVGRRALRGELLLVSKSNASRRFTEPPSACSKHKVRFESRHRWSTQAKTQSRPVGARADGQRRSFAC